MSLPVTGKRGVVIFQCLNVFIHLADVGDKILLRFPFFQQYRLGFLPNQKLLVPMEELKMVKYPSRYQGLCPKCHGDQTAGPCVHQRVLVSSLKHSRHGQPVLEQKSVRFSEPLVADWWCPECNQTAPPQALSACTHYGHVVCINQIEIAFGLRRYAPGNMTNHTNSTHPQSFDCLVSLLILFGILQKNGERFAVYKA